MLLRAAERAEQEKRQKGQIPLWVPFAVAQEYQRNLVAKMAEQERLKNTPGWEEEQERQLKDTKPFMVADKSDPNRPVWVIGAGALWREDMKDMARRTKEKPDPKTDPKWRRQHNVLNAIDQRDEMVKNLRRGRSSIFHFAHNPISRKGEL